MLGLLLFVIVALLYYIALELPLPIGQAEIPIIAALVVGACGLLAIWLGETTAVTINPQSFSSALRLGLPLLLIPVLLLLVDWLKPAPQAPDPNFPVRVMTYNIEPGSAQTGDKPSLKLPLSSKPQRSILSVCRRSSGLDAGRQC